VRLIVLDLLGALAGIVLVDLVLSGDNALVIGAAASGLPRRQRWQAIVAGGAGAILLRIAFATAATLLLHLPLLQALGGAVLVLIAVRLLAERSGPREEALAETADLVPHEPEERKPAARGFGAALLTILVADVTMSLDNVLAVGALAHGNIPLLAGGLLLSISLVLLGSALVAELIRWLPWLLDLAALVLGWTAASMVLDDRQVGPLLATLPWTRPVVLALVVGIVLVADLLLRLRRARRASRPHTRS
jgi:YjbE family integral membrane protein